MKKILLSILVVIYLIISILMTSYLLHYNDYKVAVYGDKSYMVLEHNYGNYKKNTLISIKKDLKEIKEGDNIFYYDTTGSKVTIKYDKVNVVDTINDSEISYTLENGVVHSSQNVIGDDDNITSSFILGNIIKVLSSRFGYLLIIVLPMLCIFVYEIYAFATTFKGEEKASKNTVKRNGKKA